MKSKLISVAMLATMLATPVSTALADTDVNAVQPTVEAVANGTNTDTKLPDDTKVAYTINVNLVDGSGKTLATIPASVKDSTEKLYRVRSKALYDRYNEYLGKEFSEGQVRYKASEIHQDVQRVLKDGVYVYTDNINVKVEPANAAKPAETPKANTDKKADTAKPAETGKKADAPKTSEAPKVDTAKKADDTKKADAPKVEAPKAEDAKQTDQTPKADTTKPTDQAPAQKDGDSDRVVYVANNGNANAYWVNKSNMPANTNLDTVREMSEKEAIKLGKHQADAEVLAEKHQADKAQADNAKKDDTAKIDGDTAQTDTAKKDDTAKADDTKKADTAKTDTAKTADSKANATNLPKTNDTASLAMPAFGTALMAIGAFFGFKRKNAE
jgi:putative fibrous sheath CABYR-binding protein